MKIGDFCKTGAGGTPLKSNKSFYDGGNIPWLLSGEVGNRDITETKKYITQEGLEGSSAKLFPQNTVLIAMYGATAGEVGILRCEASTNQAVCGIYPNDKVLPEYLYYFFLNHKAALVAQAVGNAQPNISQAKIKNTEVPLPPLPEQKRIVALLDTVFADLEQTRAKTEQNLNNARELFDSYLQQVFSQKGEGWVEKALGDISDANYGYTEKASFDMNGPHFLRITDIQDGEVDWSKVPFCPISEADHAKHKLKSGDIVFARTGATTGKSYLVTSPPDSVAASYLIRLRLNLDAVSPKFVKFFFQTKEYWDTVNAGMSGSAQGGFNASKLSAMKIKYPENKIEQDRLIQELTEISKYVEQVNNVYILKLSAIDELKKSILQKAFNGELTNAVA